mgnify:FL=1
MSNMFSITPVGKAAFSYPYDPGYSMMFPRYEEGNLSFQGSRQTDTDVVTVSLWNKSIFKDGYGTFLNYVEDANNYGIFRAENGTNFRFYQEVAGVSTDLNWVVQRSFDATGWMHIVLACDSGQATAANRIRLYVNNVEQTQTVTSQIVQDTNVMLHTVAPSGSQYIGDQPAGSITRHADAIYNDYIIVDGQQLTPSSFGKEKSGIWVPID